jgi:hypothetical protein
MRYKLIIGLHLLSFTLTTTNILVFGKSISFLVLPVTTFCIHAAYEIHRSNVDLERESKRQTEEIHRHWEETRKLRVEMARRNDLRAVESGLMSKEDFKRKWRRSK